MEGKSTIYRDLGVRALFIFYMDVSFRTKSSFLVRRKGPFLGYGHFFFIAVEHLIYFFLLHLR